MVSTTRPVWHGQGEFRAKGRLPWARSTVGASGGTPPKDRTPAHEGSKSVPGASQAELPEGPRLSNSVSAKMENEVVTETRDSD